MQKQNLIDEKTVGEKKQFKEEDIDIPPLSFKRYFIFRVKSTVKKFQTNEDMVKWTNKMAILYPNLSPSISVKNGIYRVNIKDRNTTILFSSIKKADKWIEVINSLDLEISVNSISIVFDSLEDLEIDSNYYYLVETKNMGSRLFQSKNKMYDWIHKIVELHPNLSLKTEKLLLDV